jgi:hypothetical protein
LRFGRIEGALTVSAPTLQARLAPEQQPEAAASGCAEQ